MCGKISAQYFYDIHTIQKIEISFSQSNWDYQLDTAKAGLDEPIMAQWVKINGVQFDTVGVKYKGNSSYNSGNTKNPIHISLDEYKNQSYMGYKDVKLGNNYADPSMIREVLSYNILSNYMDCPKSNFAQLYINGAYIGVYANDEAINKKFCADHFYSSNNVFVKCNPIVAPTAAIKSNLKTITSATDSSSYFNFYELKSNVGWNDFVALTNSVSVSTASLSSAMDMDRAIWMLAFNNVLINLDSYTGVFAQNYYLYKDNTQRYNPIMWDLNMSFGGFPFVGSSNTSMGSLSITNQQQLSASIHATDPYWPLINDVMTNPMYKRMYIAHMRTIISEMFSNNAYQTKAAQLQATIDTAVQSDANKFYSYTQFQNAMTSNYSVGSYSVPGISNLMTARVSYLLGTADFTASTPTISTPSVSNTTPNYNSTVTITANVLNTSANAVYLGYRYHVTDKFTRIVMYDDGLHNDGASGDDVYGADIPVLSGQIQYYIYAENNNAGFFSPQRAEHEFHTITANATTPTVGSLVINEFLADNTLLQKDEYSSREDWIEIFNTSNSLLDLSNVYLSDNYLLPTKWKFPAGTTIDPNAYLMVWADDDSAQVIYHTNFILNKSGEQLMLSVGSTVLDSVTYGAQGSNISYGRCPNGTGSFINLPSTSFNGANCTVGVQEHAAIMHNMNVYPNPASHRFTISVQNNNTPLNLNITNTIGQDIYTGTIKDQTSIQTESWEEGIYFIRVADSVVKLIVSK
ncbi:MAG: CotH kinase family protein [Bacteroidetes bacterium]|nr:CotH kinase family protein [Bacteroidota bacterium]